MEHANSIILVKQIELLLVIGLRIISNSLVVMAIVLIKYLRLYWIVSFH